jgi:DNA-binding MarR family transcriptional regulator
LTSKGPDQATEAILIALRRVIRAVELHSRKLVQSHGLTGPQSVILREVIAAGGLTPGELARRVSVSQATVTDIVKRLEARKLLQRHPDSADRRRVVVKATRAGERLHASAPPLLQETFVQRFASLPDWEQHMLLAALQRTAMLMDAEDIDASPLLTSGPVDAPPEAFD